MKHTMMENRSKIIPIAIAVSMAFLLAPQLQQFANASSNSPYQSGRDHGCDDAGMSDVSDRYINEEGKGPSFHTSEFMRGYNAGFNECSSSGNPGNDSRENLGSKLCNLVDSNRMVVCCSCISIRYPGLD